MLFLFFLIGFTGAFLVTFATGLFAVAAPHGQLSGLLADNDEKFLDTRQIVEANPDVLCCQSCKTKYSYKDFWSVFDNLCTYASEGMELWTGQTYNAGNYYCHADAFTCIHVSIQYLCGGGSATTVSYDGCMGYFDFVIKPGTCNGPPYPGAQVHSPDGCWVFQATADLASDFKTSNKVKLVCDASGDSCNNADKPLNTSAPTGQSYTFG